MLHKALNKIAILIIAVCLPIAVLALATESVAFSDHFYDRQHELLQIERSSGFNADDYRTVSQALQSYFVGQSDSPQLYVTKGDMPAQLLYKERELAHLADVRNLFRLGIILRNLTVSSIFGSALYLAISQKGQGVKPIRSGLTGGLIVAGCGVLGLYAAISMDFRRAFLRFHHLSFDNLLWQLNPAVHKLILLFPEQFFYNAARTIIVRSGLVLVALALITACSSCRRPKPNP